MTTINFAKTKSKAIIPSKRDEDAGYDIYPCFEDDFIEIPPHETRLIPTGIASAFSSDYYFQIEERGSTGSRGIKKSCGVIDSGYRGEWKIAIINSTEEPLFITKLDKDSTLKSVLCETEHKQEKQTSYPSEIYNKSVFYPYSKAIAQAVLHKVPKANIEEISYRKLKEIPSERCGGMLGSSGK